MIIGAVAVVYWFLIGPGMGPMPEPEGRKGVGQALTYAELRPLTGDGSPVSVGDLKDHVTLLNLWGTWCPPCRSELPHMAELAKRFAGQDAFRLVAVSYPRDGQTSDVQSLQEETAALLKQLNLVFPPTMTATTEHNRPWTS